MNQWKWHIEITRDRDNLVPVKEGQKLAKALRAFANISVDEDIKENLRRFASRFSRSVKTVKQYNKILEELYNFADLSRIWITFK